MADEPEVATQEAEANAPASSVEDLVTLDIPASDLEVRSVEQRELFARIAPFGEVVDTPSGMEMFNPGAFSGVNPKKVVLRLGHDGPASGRGMSIEERADGAYMAFKVSKTLSGDELLQLAVDEVTPFVSVAYKRSGSKGALQYRNGRRFTAWDSLDLREVATTWKPYYERAAILEVRSMDETGEPVVEAVTSTEPESVTEVAPMSDVAAPDNGATPEAPVAQADNQVGMVQAALSSMTNITGSLTALGDRMEKLEERSRSDFTIPGVEPEHPAATRGEWVHTVLRMMSNERVSERELEERALADLITTDNMGVVPDAFSTEIIGVIDPRRPFMQSTRRLDTPTSGMSLVVPRIVTRPTVGIQATEKTELTSTATAIDTVSFDAVSKGGAADISLQLLKRSSPSFLTLYMDLLFEAYAIDSEQEAVEALIASGVDSGGALDPEDLSLGSAWSTSFDAVSRSPDTIWLSSAAVALFIDAKATGTNAPLYSNLNANFTAGGGVGGSISGLRAVHVPALNATDIDVVVGPSSGFAWAEDGTYTLQVDVPAKAGRDVAVIGILWFAPLYPAAFTAYSVAGGGS